LITVLLRRPKGNKLPKTLLTIPFIKKLIIKQLLNYYILTPFKPVGFVFW
jgi:hypothetical protein